MPIRARVAGLGDLVFPDGTSDDVIQRVVKREIFRAGQAKRKDELVAAGGLPAEEANYEPASGYEKAATFLTHAATAVPAASLARFTAPIDAAISFGRNLQSSPDELAAKFQHGLESGSPSEMFGQFVQTPTTSAVSQAADSTANTINEAIGVRPNAITDVPSAAGTIAGTVAAPYAEKGIVKGATAGTAPLRRTLSEKTAPQIMRNVANPKNAQLQFGADPGEFLVGLKTDGNNLKSLEPKIEAKIQQLEAKADKIAYNTERGRSASIDYEQHVKDAFDKHIKAARFDGNEGLATRLEQVRDNEVALLKRQTGGTGEAPAWAGRRYQQGLGERVRKFSEDPIDGTVRAARQDAWEGIKDATDEAVPELKAINQQIHSGIEAKKAINNQAATQAKANPLTIRGQVTNAVSGPYIRTRVAAGLRGLYGAPQAPEPMYLPNPSSSFTPQPGQEIVNWFQRNGTVPQGGSVNVGQPEGAIVDWSQGQSADPRALAQQPFDRAQFSPPQPPPRINWQPSAQQTSPVRFAAGDMGGAVPQHVMEEVEALYRAGRISAEDYQGWLNSRGQQANMNMLRYSGSPRETVPPPPPAPPDASEDWLLRLITNYGQH